ncbi:MAG TPA: hypothetical protein VN578_16640 [Candidatus Binatia bacterium]|jgi:hypothetical protein|nr:hypothetical protein [Candidatus Binatia bacterium]
MNDKPLKADETPDPIERLLRESVTPLPDDGFTRRVMLALPPRGRPDLLRFGLLGSALLAGAVVFLCRAPAAGETVLEFLRHARHGEWVLVLGLAPVIVGLGALLWGLVSVALEES